jgi:hypothetical protein
VSVKTGIIVTLVLITGFTSFSCKKDEFPKATILVYDTLNVPQKDVRVVVYSDPNGAFIDPNSMQLLDSGRTNSSGEVNFTFKRKAILQVRAEQYTLLYHRDATSLLVLNNSGTITKVLKIK